MVLALLTFLNIPEPVSKPGLRSLLGNLGSTLDLVGFALFAPAAIMFFLGLQYGGNQYPWNSAIVIGLLCGGAANFVVFFCWEYYKGDDAMIPFYMLKKRVLWSSCITMFFITGVLTGAAYYLPLYFQSVLGVSPIMSGVYFLPNILMQITMAMISGVLGEFVSLCIFDYTRRCVKYAVVQKYGYYLPFVVGGTALASLGYGLLSMLTPTFPTATRVGFQIIAGTGIGSAAAMVSLNRKLHHSNLFILTRHVCSPLSQFKISFHTHRSLSQWLSLSSH